MAKDGARPNADAQTGGHTATPHFPYFPEILSSLINSVPLSIYAKDSSGRFIFANTHYCQGMNKKPSQILGKTDYDLHPRDMADKYRADDEYIMATRETRKIEESWQSLGGKTYFVTVIKAPLLDGTDPVKVIGTVGVFWDITDRKKAEIQVQEERNLLKSIIDSIPSFVYMKDTEGRFVITNQALAQFLGAASATELVGNSDFDYFPTDVARSFAEPERRLFTKGEPVTDLVESYLFKGKQYWISTTKKPLYNLDGELIGLVGIGHDITRIKEIENKLRESEERYSAVINQALEGIYLLDPDTMLVLESNESFQKMLGYAQEQLGRMQIFDFVLHDRAEVSSNINQVLTGNKNILGERKYRRKSGGIVDVEVSAKLIQYGGRAAVLVIVRDTTEKRKTEKERETLKEQLRQAQKLEAIGTLAGGVAHDLNNILAGIVSYPELILLQLPQDSPLRKQVRLIHESGQRAAAVVADLLTVARGVASTKESHSLNTLINEQLDSPEHRKTVEQHPGIEYVVACSRECGNILCSPVHVKKCVMNLLLNASEAISGKGTIEIKTDTITIDLEEGARLSLKPGKYHSVLVRDSGKGISDEDRLHIFEPFYTRKKMGSSGSGLGLAIVWNTMQDHGGTVVVESGDHGSSFTLYFPAHQSGTTSYSRESGLSELQGKGEHILVVDNEPHLLEIARLMLEQLGYRVSLAGSGQEAVEFISKQKVDLVVLDMLMEPGINGYITYSKILQIAPGQKAIIVSGFSENAEVQKTQELGAGQFLLKPYTVKSLGTAVKRELATR